MSIVAVTCHVYPPHAVRLSLLWLQVLFGMCHVMVVCGTCVWCSPSCRISCVNFDSPSRLLLGSVRKGEDYRSSGPYDAYSRLVTIFESSLHVFDFCSQYFLIKFVPLPPLSFFFSLFIDSYALLVTLILHPIP